MPPEAYAEAAERLYRDGVLLHGNGNVPTASHLYGLAAECALKECLSHIVSAPADIPHKHLPDLTSDVRRWVGGRRLKGLAALLSKRDYMDGWRIENRYWATATFSVAQCKGYRDHAMRTLKAVGIGGV